VPTAPQLRVNYLELTQTPAAIPEHVGNERVGLETLTLEEYLEIYRRVGEPLRWDQRLNMPQEELAGLLQAQRSRIYVLRDAAGGAQGLCEFDRGQLPEIELKNFGLVPQAQGRRLGTWLLRTALHSEWQARPTRIWLHTDEWDHPAALSVYERAGFRIYMTRTEHSGPL
jgi:ribosomal protein S18 acetylase RimI-like enzyme